MSRPSRPVILASVRGRTVSLRAVSNGSGYNLEDVRRLATDAGLVPEGTTRSCYIGLSLLPDLEAMAEHRGCVVVRVGRSS